MIFLLSQALKNSLIMNTLNKFKIQINLNFKFGTKILRTLKTNSAMDREDDPSLQIMPQLSI